MRNTEIQLSDLARPRSNRQENSTSTFPRQSRLSGKRTLPKPLPPQSALSPEYTREEQSLGYLYSLSYKMLQGQGGEAQTPHSSPPCHSFPASLFEKVPDLTAASKKQLFQAAFSLKPCLHFVGRYTVWVVFGSPRDGVHTFDKYNTIYKYNCK